jgi:hypothetical protein
VRTPQVVFLLALAGPLGGCPGGPEPLFPEDYRATYVEVRNCRQSADHDLHMIRVLADPAARDPYVGRDAPIPVGAILVKEEYDFGDLDCTGPIVRWTAMQRLEPGTAPLDLDWYWQAADPDRNVTEDNPERCANCHQGCVEPDGYSGTCAVP